MGGNRERGDRPEKAQSARCQESIMSRSKSTITMMMKFPPEGFFNLHIGEVGDYPISKRE